jgi:hypothetical protein
VRPPHRALLKALHENCSAHAASGDQSAGECREFLRQWEKERKGSTASRKNAKDRVPSMDVERRMSLDNLLNATLLLTPSTLIFLFKRALSGSNLVFLVGTTDHQKGGKECKRDGR